MLGKESRVPQTEMNTIIDQHILEEIDRLGQVLFAFMHTS